MAERRQRLNMLQITVETHLVNASAADYHNRMGCSEVAVVNRDFCESKTKSVFFCTFIKVWNLIYFFKLLV